MIMSLGPYRIMAESPVICFGSAFCISAELYFLSIIVMSNIWFIRCWYIHIYEIKFLRDLVGMSGLEPDRSDMKGRVLGPLCIHPHDVNPVGYDPTIGALRARCYANLASDSWRSLPVLIRRPSARQAEALPLS